jgi:hypothetical protein
MRGLLLPARVSVTRSDAQAVSWHFEGACNADRSYATDSDECRGSISRDHLQLLSFLKMACIITCCWKLLCFQLSSSPITRERDTSRGLVLVEKNCSSVKGRINGEWRSVIGPDQSNETRTGPNTRDFFFRNPYPACPGPSNGDGGGRQWQQRWVRIRGGYRVRRWPSPRVGGAGGEVDGAWHRCLEVTGVRSLLTKIWYVSHWATMILNLFVMGDSSPR